jgi:hypothetical protein
MCIYKRMAEDNGDGSSKRSKNEWFM